MSQKIQIYIPTFISDQNYNPNRVLPRLYFYNGTIESEQWYINQRGFGSLPVNEFPYFDHYNVVTGSFPTTGSNSLLFNNETPVYGAQPNSTLYTEYWSKYIALLYNPKTRLINASAIIPLADYFKMELNDIVEFRSNFYHLRAINDYNLKTGECKIQLLGPIIQDTLSSGVYGCDFSFTSATVTTTTTTTSTTTTSTTTTSTTTTTTAAPTTTTTTLTPTTTTTSTTSTTTTAAPTTTTTTAAPTTTTTTVSPTTTTTTAGTTTTTTTTLAPATFYLEIINNVPGLRISGSLPNPPFNAPENTILMGYGNNANNNRVIAETVNLGTGSFLYSGSVSLTGNNIVYSYLELFASSSIYDASGSLYYRVTQFGNNTQLYTNDGSETRTGSFYLGDFALNTPVNFNTYSSVKYKWEFFDPANPVLWTVNGSGTSWQSGLQTGSNAATMSFENSVSESVGWITVKDLVVGAFSNNSLINGELYQGANLDPTSFVPTGSYWRIKQINNDASIKYSNVINNSGSHNYEVILCTGGNAYTTSPGEITGQNWGASNLTPTQCYQVKRNIGTNTIGTFYQRAFIPSGCGDSRCI